MYTFRYLDHWSRCNFMEIFNKYINILQCVAISIIYLLLVSRPRLNTFTYMFLLCKYDIGSDCNYAFVTNEY